MELKEALSLFSQEAERLQQAQELLKKEIGQLKERLKSSHETFESLFSTLADALVYVNQEGIVELANETFLELFKFERAAIIAKPYESCFDDTFFGFSMKEALNERKISRRLFLSHQIGKRIKELEVIATSVQSRKGGVLLMIKKAEVALRLEMASERHREWRELHEMVGSLAHEIRNPLSGIQGFATLLLRELKDDNAHAMASSILDGTKMISRLVEEALTTSAAPEINLVKCDLIALIEETLLFTEVSLDIRDRFKFNKNCDSLSLFIDRELFKRALFNLLKNAHEATAHIIPVNINLRMDEKNVWIDIKDQGPGIEIEQMKKLFTVNFSTKKGGHGFGLFESYKVITALGGSIQIESKLYDGATFTVQLPLNNVARKNSNC